MRLGILQTGHVPDQVAQTDGPYSALFGAFLAHRGYDQRLWSVVDGAFPDVGAQAADAWLITGSKHGAYEAHGWIPPLEALIRDIREAGLPLIGSCFGHQIIAQALGGRVEKAREGWQVGATEYRLGPRALTLNAWHQDQVTALPPGATVHASAPDCRYAVLAHGPRILTTQPHPEFENSVIETLIEVRGDALTPAQKAQAQAGLRRANDNRLVADWVGDVIEGADATRSPSFLPA